MQETSPHRVTILAARQAERRRRRFRWAAASLVVAALSSAVVAVRVDSSRTLAAVDPEDLPVGPPTPELAATGWLNSPPLTTAALVGKVVLYDFWTYSCVNCVRTIPHLRAFYDRYQRDGLEIVGVHSPEFAFERQRANVAAAVERLGVTWPVALDDERNIWNAFQNRVWPAAYVTDREGNLRYMHVGEGRYRETEAVLRHLLGVADGAPGARPPDGGGPEDPEDGGITAETHLGTARGDAARDGRHDYGSPSGPPDLGHVGLGGVWEADAERVRAAEADSVMTLSYRAREVNLVMASAGDPVDVVVEFDGYPVPAALRTPETRLDADGRTFVRVAAPGLYRLASGRSVGRHVLRLLPHTSGLEAFAFTFG